MSGFLLERFIELDLASALQVVMLGFIGGILSGFIGSGGAFFMTPGMMNLGVPGVVSVGSNITHKFGKAMMGAKRHGEYGNVDKRLAGFLVVTAFIGIRVAVWINSALFKTSGDGHGTGGSAASDLYISVVFISILSLVALSMLRDALKPGDEGAGPSMKIAEFLSRLNIPPYVNFQVADVRVSLWLLLAVGLATGYLAGTIGVGGFIGVPAMIYVFGVPTAVAAGSELYLAMFMGAWGCAQLRVSGLRGHSPHHASLPRVAARHLHRGLRREGGQGADDQDRHRHDHHPVRREPRHRGTDVHAAARVDDDESGVGHVLQSGQQGHAVRSRNLGRDRHLVQRDQGIPAAAADRVDADRTERSGGGRLGWSSGMATS